VLSLLLALLSLLLILILLLLLFLLFLLFCILSVYYELWSLCLLRLCFPINFEGHPEKKRGEAKRKGKGESFGLRGNQKK
jgi:hypothetical protein